MRYIQNLIFVFFENKDVLDYIYTIFLIIVGIFTIIIGFMTINISKELKKQSKDQYEREEKNRKLDLVSKSHSYLIPTNSKDSIVDIKLNSISVIEGIKENNNVLIGKENKLSDSPSLEITLFFESVTGVYPSKVFVEDLVITYDRDTYHNMNIFRDANFFRNINDMYKPIYVDKEKLISFKVILIIDETLKEKLVSSLEKDSVIQLEFNISFENPFNVYTRGKYNMVLHKQGISKNVFKDTIGSDNMKIEYKIGITNFLVEKIDLK